MITTPERKRRAWQSLPWLIAALWLGACAGAPGSPPVRVIEVTLTSPPDTAVLYTSAALVAGTAQGATDGDRLMLSLLTDDGEALAQAQATVTGGAFAVEIVHGYSGTALPLTVAVHPLDADPADPTTRYAAASVLLASLEHRPDGVFADILAPEDGAPVGGDLVEVLGRVSGIVERSFEVALLADDGTPLDTRRVHLPSPYPLDDLPWRAELTTGGYTGNAVIVARLSDDLTLSVPVVIGQVAG